MSDSVLGTKTNIAKFGKCVVKLSRIVACLEYKIVKKFNETSNKDNVEYLKNSLEVKIMAYVKKLYKKVEMSVFC